MGEDQFSSVVQDLADGGIVTHFLVILEVMTEEEIDLRVASSESLTAWQALGMLNVANDMISVGYANRYDKDDD